MYVTEGLTIEEIAVRENIGPEIVQGSIDCFKEYRFHHSNDMVALKMNEVVMSQLDQVATVFSDGMKANKLVPAGGGEFKNVADTAMRLKTVETLKGMIEVTQPKAPLVQNNTQFNNGTSHGGPPSGGSFEQRLRLARERRGLSNNEEQIIDSAEDAEEPESLEDEMAGIGVDITDEEDDDEDDEA